MKWRRNKIVVFVISLTAERRIILHHFPYTYIVGLFITSCYECLYSCLCVCLWNLCALHFYSICFLYLLLNQIIFLLIQKKFINLTKCCCCYCCWRWGPLNGCHYFNVKGEINSLQKLFQAFSVHESLKGCGKIPMVIRGWVNVYWPPIAKIRLHWPELRSGVTSGQFHNIVGWHMVEIRSSVVRFWYSGVELKFVTLYQHCHIFVRFFFLSLSHTYTMDFSFGKYQT